MTRWQFPSVWILALGLAPIFSGCASGHQTRIQEQNAFLAGQNAAFQAAMVPNASQFVTVLGPVQIHRVPWVAGLTLVQALATAIYQDPHSPSSITITRDHESASLNPDVLFQGAVVPLEPGDVIELQP